MKYLQESAIQNEISFT